MVALVFVSTFVGKKLNNVRLPLDLRFLVNYDT
jgi:hypothetical protein